MDSFNKAFAQLSEVVQSMTPGARITAAASLALVLASVIWLSNQRSAEPETFLMGGQSFSAAQLRDMESAFGKAGLMDQRIDGDRVRVPRGQQSKYMAALADAGALPEDFGEYLRQAVNSGNFMLPGSQQEAKTKIALQSDLQLVISRMKGVKKAFVHIAEETSRGFPPTKTVTASVGIEPRDEAAIDEATKADIRALVASAWGGLKREAVTIVMTSRSPSPPATEPAADGRTLSWLARNWKPLGMGGLMLVGLFVLRSTVRSAPRPAARGDASAVNLPQSLFLANDDTAQPAGTAAEGAAPRAPTPVVVPPESLREELIVMVREHPQSAASVLRTWIGNGSQ
jgi:flagellar biosynthesis/type III secretory pathway M-ring protein FliF/YscJ